MPYTPTVWVSGVTPVDAAEMNNLETQHAQAIADVGLYKVLKAANETVNNSTVLQNDDELLYALAANETWHFRFVIRHYVSAGGGSNIKFAITVPALATLHWLAVYIDTAVLLQKVSISGTGPILVKNYVIADAQITILEGIVINGANAGNLQLQWAQNAAVAENTIVMANSCLFMTKLA